MTTRVGRSRTTSAVSVTNATLVTASGYEIGDSMGWPYEIPYAVGNDGGLLTQSLLYMTASGEPNIRVHFYARSASGVTAGAANAVDVPYHLGYVDHTSWVSAGAGLVVSQATTPNLSLYNNGPDGKRSVWAVLEARNTAFGFGASATPLRHKIGVLQD
jgi:hypothetical protein